MFSRPVLWFLTLPLFAVGAAAHAEGTGARPQLLPLHPKTLSVEVVRQDTPIWFGPDAKVRRGSARQGARLPLLARARGAGCNGAWSLVGPESWICEDGVRTSNWPATQSMPTTSSTSLPYDYYFVGTDGSFGYATLRLAEEGVPDSQLEPSFAVAISHIDSKANGERYGLTSHGLWVPLRDLVPANSSPFRGVHLTDPQRSSAPGAPLNVAWTFRDKTRAHSKPGYALTGVTLPRLSRLDVSEHHTVKGKRWLRDADGRWFRRDDLRQPKLLELPPELLTNERWMHIDTSEQTLVAYQGDQPVFATLVSSGKGGAGTPEATPTGRYRIWVKLRTTDMTNLEDESANRYYAIEEVPWVMFFHRGYGLHGAFWHDAFGTKRSHGCVNLSPSDARFLFEWAGPELPAGWHAAHPTRYDRGTLLVID